MTVEETWELAGRLFTSKGLEEENISKIFSGKTKREIFEMPPYKVKNIIDKWDQEKKICIGDLVKYSDGTKGVIVDENKGFEYYYVFDENGCMKSVEEKYLTKIKHTEFIEELLKKIRYV